MFGNGARGKEELPVQSSTAVDRCELVHSLEREWCDALCAKDDERLRAMVHPDFTLIGSRAGDAFSMSRDEWLDAVQKRELLGIDLDVKQAVVFDNVMVGTVEADWCLQYMGKQIRDRVLLTDVWVRDGGRWQVIRRHSSPLPAAQTAPAQPRPR